MNIIQLEDCMSTYQKARCYCRQFREEKGYTQTQLANRIEQKKGVVYDVSKVSRWENKDSDHFGELDEYLSAFDIKPVPFLSFIDNVDNEKANEHMRKGDALQWVKNNLHSQN